MIGKLLAFCFFALLFIGLGFGGTVDGLVKGVHNIKSNPVLQNMTSYTVQQFKQGFSNDTTSSFISEIRSELK